jgi:hypothetical protein
VTRWGLREKLAPLQGARLWAVRACWLGLGLMALAVVIVAYPVHYVVPKKGLSLVEMQRVFAAIWLGGMAAVGGLWWAARERADAGPRARHELRARPRVVL